MLAEEYKTIEEKTQYFHNAGVRVCFNVEKIFDLLNTLIEKKDFIFRGCGEAKYKMYNSAQRYYMGNELYRQVGGDGYIDHFDDFMQNLINECKIWNKSTVDNFLINSGINENNCLAYLSFMQHYGVPTPLIDFTSDPYIALFFAIDNVNYVASNTEIDNYFSLYYTFQSMGAFAVWQNMFDEKYKDGILTYKELSQNTLHILTTNSKGFSIVNNTNIINQKGLFFYNNSPDLPLEVKYLEFYDYLEGELGKEKIEEFMVTDTLFNCINFHKSLIPYIKEKLVSLGITRDYIYPDFYKMKDKALTSASIKALRTNVHISDEKAFWEK